MTAPTPDPGAAPDLPDFADLPEDAADGETTEPPGSGGALPPTGPVE